MGDVQSCLDVTICSSEIQLHSRNVNGRPQDFMKHLSSCQRGVAGRFEVVLSFRHCQQLIQTLSDTQSLVTIESPILKTFNLLLDEILKSDIVIASTSNWWLSVHCHNYKTRILDVLVNGATNIKSDHKPLTLADLQSMYRLEQLNNAFCYGLWHKSVEPGHVNTFLRQLRAANQQQAPPFQVPFSRRVLSRLNYSPTTVRHLFRCIDAAPRDLNVQLQRRQSPFVALIA